MGEGKAPVLQYTFIRALNSGQGGRLSTGIGEHMPRISRRKLLGSTVITGAAAVFGSSSLNASQSPSSAPANGVDYYQKLGVTPFINAAGTYRSEEHTSELQSRENLVCRLL